MNLITANSESSDAGIEPFSQAEAFRWVDVGYSIGAGALAAIVFFTVLALSAGVLHFGKVFP